MRARVDFSLILLDDNLGNSAARVRALINEVPLNRSFDERPLEACKYEMFVRGQFVRLNCLLPSIMHNRKFIGFNIALTIFLRFQNANGGRMAQDVDLSELSLRLDDACGTSALRRLDRHGNGPGPSGCGGRHRYIPTTRHRSRRRLSPRLRDNRYIALAL